MPPPDRGPGSGQPWQPTEAGAHLRGRKISDTAPEMLLRHALHALGLRYRLKRRVGPFRPDIVFPSSKTAIFVDGCFWHGCPVHGPAAFRGPNAAKWRDKLRANRERDARAAQELTAIGWRVVRVWECDVRRDVIQAAEAVATVVQEATRSSSGLGSA
ncbi:MAG: very short patch repair endonuclease [Mycobacteriaceae bacterium]